jgi:hypothetical protein
LPCSKPVYRVSITEASCAAVDLAFSGFPTYEPALGKEAQIDSSTSYDEKTTILNIKCLLFAHLYEGVFVISGGKDFHEVPT